MRQIIFTIVLISCLSLQSQEDKIDSLLNDLLYNENDPLFKPENPVKFNFFYAGINSGSKSFYAGREIGSNMFNVSSHLFYYSSLGLFLGISGNWYDQLAPGYSSTIVSSGYFKPLGNKKTFTFRSSYNRYFYHQPDTGIVYPFKNNLTSGLSFRKKGIGGRITASFLFGEDFGMNISTVLYSRITLLKFGKYNKIYTMPEFSAFLGSETVEKENTGQMGNNQTDSQSTISLENVYGLLNTQLYLPLCFSIGDFDLEIGYSVNFPSTQDINITYPVKSFYSVSLGYLLPIIKTTK